MGTLFSAFDIARSGMQVAQVQLDVTAHNIANATKTGYSRQRAELAARQPISMPFGQIGRGVEVSDIRRVRDLFLDHSYRLRSGGLGEAETAAKYYSLLEDAFLEPTENGLGARLNYFFDSLNDFANNVESEPVREAVLSETKALASSLNELAVRLHELQTDANEEIQGLVPEINSIAERLAELNMQIRISEANGTTANDLRDNRDVLLDELSRLVNISTSDRADGQIDVFISGEVLVTQQYNRRLEAIPNAALSPDRSDLLEVRFEDNGTTPEIREGELAGAFRVRDTVIPEIRERMDAVAAALILQINRIHSQGNGIQNLSAPITGAYAVDDPAAPLNAAGLPFDVSSGSFDVAVYDGSGAYTTTTITIDASSTLESVAAALNGVAHLDAEATADGRLRIEPESGYTYAFANDTSGVLAALGVNVLLTGSTIGDIAVNQDILDNPSLLSSSYSLDPDSTGDNQAALAMAEVRTGLYFDSASSTIDDYYESTVAILGIETRANEQILEVAQSFVDDAEQRRTSVSGVSLDEEVAQLIVYQRSFQASARVISITDSMLDTLINGTR